MQEDHGIVLRQVFGLEGLVENISYPQGGSVVDDQVLRLAISPLLPATCRFIPTCSEYGLVAVQRFGFLKGLYLTCKRILRCRPGGGRGYDPVPDTFHL